MYTVLGEDAAEQQDARAEEVDLERVDLKAAGVDAVEHADHVVDQLVLSAALDSDVIEQHLGTHMQQVTQRVSHGRLHARCAIAGTLQLTRGAPDALVGHDAEVGLAVGVEGQLPVAGLEVDTAEEGVAAQVLDEGLGAGQREEVGLCLAVDGA